MTLKLIGATMIIVGCGGFGFILVMRHKYEVRTLRQLCSMLDYISCELQYHLTPLPELCRRIANIYSGCLGDVFSELAIELERQISPNVSLCMNAVLKMHDTVPPLTQNSLRKLGKSLGHFDLDGQLKGIESVKIESQQQLETYSKNQDIRLRSYQTLALCAGAAMAILFI